ncbi:MAG TPA: diguanylate cyclase, partial [Solirubrobacteraceae bacterium]|nr:diguanylate cyclase [Solirubrobacteraceae bacterium]
MAIALAAPSPGQPRVAAELTRRFGDALRHGEGAAAERVVEDALADGMAAEAVQSLVIAPAMVMIGELWQSRLIGIADEHLATAICQRALVRLFEALSARRVRARSRERVLLAAVEGQRHVLGLRMIGDVLEGAGFDVLYLGESVPIDSLQAFVAQHRPAVVGLSFGIAADVDRLAETLWALHEHAPETRIMLGGRAVPLALRSAGYAYVESSMDVVGVVEGLVAAAPARLPAVVDRLRAATPRSRSRLLEAADEIDVVAERLARAAEQAGDVARRHVRRAEAFRELALRDPLTDLANRRAFDDELTALTADPTAGGALLMIDVDAFKAVNDERGHDAGDRLLRAIGKTIGGKVRRGDVAARFGGDEFAVLLPGASVALACEIGERIRVAVGERVRPFSVSV